MRYLIVILALLIAGCATINVQPELIAPVYLEEADTDDWVDNPR